MRPFPTLIITISLILSGSLSANVLPRDMLKRTQANYMEQLCASPSYTACLEISHEQCLQYTASYLDQCIGFLPTMVPMTPATESELLICNQQEARLLGINEDKLADCGKKELGE